MENLGATQINRILSYAGFVLVSYELIKGMIVRPIQVFYKDTTFGEKMPFKSYEKDVLSRSKNEFEACLLYLKDFMEEIDDKDFATIQDLRMHRNDLAHNLVDRLKTLKIKNYHALFEDVRRTLFRLSNYRAYIEIGSDPEFKGINWETVRGHEYLLYEKIVQELEKL